MNSMKDQHLPPGEIDRKPNRLSRFIIHFVMPAITLACGVLLTIYLLNTGPQARPAKRLPTSILVEVEKLSGGPQQTKVSAMGEIIPAREIDIRPQVSGEITKVSDEFQLGGYFQADEELLAIDKTDYELKLKQIESDVAKAESDLAMEMGNQRIAEREFALLGEKVSDEEKNLILRKPQLEILQAVRNDAQARLNQARLDIERTSISAPFNGVVTEKLVDIGAKVGTTSTLAKIVGTDAFWLRVTLPVEQLQWLSIPDNSSENGAKVTIYPQGSTSLSQPRYGKVVRLIAALEGQGRMAQLLVRIDDPLSLRKENRNKPPLLLGSYVRAEIEGETIDSGFRISRANLHDGNTVWLMDSEGKLNIRQVEVSYRGHDTVIINRGVHEGETLVVSSLSSPVEGTALRVSKEKEQDNSQLADKEDGDNGKRRMSRVN